MLLPRQNFGKAQSGAPWHKRPELPTAFGRERRRFPKKFRQSKPRILRPSKAVHHRRMSQCVRTPRPPRARIPFDPILKLPKGVLGTVQRCSDQNLRLVPVQQAPNRDRLPRPFLEQACFLATLGQRAPSQASLRRRRNPGLRLPGGLSPHHLVVLILAHIRLIFFPQVRAVIIPHLPFKLLFDFGLAYESGVN